LMMTTGRLALLQMIAALASSAASSSDAQPFTLAPSNADSAAVTSNDANASTQTPAPIIFHRMVPDGGQEKWSGYIRSWDRLLNQTTEDGQPRWQVKEHRDSDFRAILELAVPHLVDRIMAFHHPVEINDVSRYAALYHYGGVYADLDVELLSPEVFAQAARTADVIFPHEKTRLMGQSIMISPQPRNPFWLKLIEYITEQYNADCYTPFNTGPDAVTTYWNSVCGQHFEQHLTDPSATPRVVVADGLMDGPVTVHHQSGSWRGVDSAQAHIATCPQKWASTLDAKCGAVRQLG